MNVKVLRPFLIGSIIILFSINANSQSLIKANPADLSSPFSLYRNPAVIPFKKNQMMLGMKVVQLGFLDNNSLGLRNSFLSGSYNNLSGGVGIGFTAQYFTTPIFAESQLSLKISRSFWGIAAIGLNINYLNHSFNKANFNEYVDIDDPLVRNRASKSSFSIGMGVLLSPLTNLNIGLAINHLNEPNISLVDNNVVKNKIYSLGISYLFHFFEPSIGVVKTEDLFIPDFSLRYFLSSSNFVRFAYAKDYIMIGGQFNINESFGINCYYDYPMNEIGNFASGSPQFSFIYSPMPSIILDVNAFGEYPSEMPKIDELISEQDLVSANNLTVLEKVVKVSLAESCQNEFWSVAPYILEKFVLDVADGALNFPVERLTGKFNENERREVSTDFLYSLLKNVDNLSWQPIRLIVPNDKKNELVNTKQAIMADSSLIQYNFQYFTSFKFDEKENRNRKAFTKSVLISQSVFIPAKLIFILISSKQITNKRGKWKLLIKDAQKKIIKQFNGFGQVPHKITWHCQDSEEKIKNAGKYSYQLIMGRFRSALKYFNVKRIKRTNDIMITKKFQTVNKKIKSIDVIIN